MCTTYSGILVTPENSNVPTLHDIAVSLGRSWRWEGSTHRLWTTLHHSVAGCILAEKLGQSADVQAGFLLHDAHECITGDIPRPTKVLLGPVVRDIQDTLDLRFFRYYDLPNTCTIWPALAYLDDAVLYAEASLLFPPGQFPKEIVFLKPIQEALDSVQFVLREYPEYEDSMDPNGRLVLHYLKLLKARSVVDAA